MEDDIQYCGHSGVLGYGESRSAWEGNLDGTRRLRMKDRLLGVDRCWRGELLVARRVIDG